MDPATIAASLLSIFGLFRDKGSPNASTGLSPDLQQQASDTLGYQNRRLARTEPIHQAAMAMASRLAPAYARGAMSAPSGTSGSSAGISPAVLAAMKLMLDNQRTSGGSGGPAPGYGMGFSPADFERGGVFGPGQDPYLFGNRPLGPVGPGMNPSGYRDPGPGWPAFFSGNPAGAFTGGGVIGGTGEQNYGGQPPGRARVR